MPFLPSPGTSFCHPFGAGPDGARFVRAAASSWHQARLAHALGDEGTASLLRAQARARARTAARYREQFRAWKIAAD
jgi:glycosyltransferase A (GT-A) superfamily protein (DUF2064 family)